MHRNVFWIATAIWLAAIAVGETSEALSTLLSNCQIGGRVSCDDDIYQKVWIKIEASDGEVTKVDMHSISRSNLGSVEAITYTYVPNTRFDPSKLRRLLFDCEGHFMDVTNSSSQEMDAPPRSVVGQVAALVCGKTR